MRRWVIATAAFSLTACCSRSTPSPTVKEAIVATSLREDEIKFQQEFTQREKYAVRLAASPIYRSSIRDYLITNSDQYRQSYRILIDQYYGLERTFQCIHSVDIINRVLTDRWQIVRCDQNSATFLRPHSKLPTCNNIPSIPERFSTLRIWFSVIEINRDSAQTKASTRYLYQILPQVFSNISLFHLNRRVGPNIPQDSILRRGSTQHTFEDFIINIRSNIAMSFHVGRTNNYSCLRNARGWIVANRHVITIDAPIYKYSDMREALIRSANYLGNE